MSKATHTPGPWHVSNKTKGRNQGTFIRGQIGRIGVTHDVCRIYNCRAAGENANLIAAAPDMLEALECQQDFLRNPDVTSLHLPAGIREKWGERYSQEFRNGRLSGMAGLYRLAKLLTEKALAKAKGEADG